MSTLASVNIYDLFANRPAFGIPGRMFWASNTGNAYYDTGSAWVTIAAGSNPLTTKGDLFGFSTVGARIPVGTNGQVLTADSGQTLGVKWAPGGAGGGNYSLLQSVTASSSATVDVTAFDPLTYDSYELHFIGILPATNNVTMKMLMSTNGGATFDTGSNYDNNAIVWLAGATAALASNNDAFMKIETNISSTSGFGIKGKLSLVCPSAGNAALSGTFASLDASSGDRLIGWSVSNFYFGGAPVNAIRLITSSGNIASGTIRLYGIS